MLFTAAYRHLETGQKTGSVLIPPKSTRVTLTDVESVADLEVEENLFRVDRVKVCFVGPQKAGKSSLIQSLMTGKPSLAARPSGQISTLVWNALPELKVELWEFPSIHVF